MNNEDEIACIRQTRAVLCRLTGLLQTPYILIMNFSLPVMAVNIFSGSENSLEMRQLYSVRYNCDFELLMFPFDAQVRMHIYIYIYI